MRSFFSFPKISVFLLSFGVCFGLAEVGQAAVCSIATDTVIDQAYVTSNSCSSIDIEGNVSTTWIGTVDLSGAGTVTVKR
jgi:hypothetical protein